MRGVRKMRKKINLDESFLEINIAVAIGLINSICFHFNISVDEALELLRNKDRFKELNNTALALEFMEYGEKELLEHFLEIDTVE